MTKPDHDMNDLLREKLTKRRRNLRWGEEELERPRKTRRPIPKPSNGKGGDDDRAIQRSSRRE